MPHIAWTWWVVGGLVVLALLWGSRRPRPRVGEVWFAEVPFEDGTGSKDRPVLVLSVHGKTCSVARFTSQNRDARRDHERVPVGVTGLPTASWINLRPTTLRRSAFRRRTGKPGKAYVSWYLEASTSRHR